MSKETQLFDYVLVVSIENDGGQPKSYVDYRFPPSQGKDPLADTIVQFCFPEAELWLEKKKLKEGKNTSESFSFVLTEADGSRKFGYCRRLIAIRNKELMPECFCIISSLPSVALFIQLLNIVEELRKKSSSAVFSFLKSVLAKSFPKPGETLVIRTFENEVFEIKRSEKNYLLEYISFYSFFKNISISKILDIFAGLLTECRVILCSKSVSLLSSSVLALTGLLYPFTWHHIYIPILPKALMSYCCAPMPFLVGILSSNLSDLNTYPLEEVILFDLDTGKYLRDTPANADYKKVLPASAKNLKLEIESILKSGTSPRKIDLAISQAFLNFAYINFSNYESFIENHAFDKAKFYQSRPSDVRNFLDRFQETQMYEMFIKEREKMSKEGTLNLCALSKAKFSETNLKTLGDIASEEQSEQSRCIKCGIHLLQDDFIEKHGKLYCKDCYTKKKAKKQRLRSMIPHLSVSMPTFAAKSLAQPPIPTYSSSPSLKVEEERDKEEKKKDEVAPQMNTKPKHSASFVSYFKKENEKGKDESPSKQRNVLVASSETPRPPNSSSSPSRVTIAFGNPPNLSSFSGNTQNNHNSPGNNPSLIRAMSPQPQRRIPKFCIECGSSLIEGICPSCTQKPRFCPNCGASLYSGVCLSCSRPKKFCVKCGTKTINGLCALCTGGV